MYSVNGDSIILTRGDTLFLNLSLTNPDGSDYEPADGDSIRFAMKRKIKDQDCLILKEIPTDTMVLELEPSDTKSLSFGTYVYDIELTTATGRVSTVILGNLELTKEVY